MEIQYFLSQISYYEWLLDDDMGPSHRAVVIPHSLGGPGRGRWSRHWLMLNEKYERELKNGSTVAHIRESTDDEQWTDHQR